MLGVLHLRAADGARPGSGLVHARRGARVAARRRPGLGTGAVAVLAGEADRHRRHAWTSDLGAGRRRSGVRAARARRGLAAQPANRGARRVRRRRPLRRDPRLRHRTRPHRRDPHRRDQPLALRLDQGRRRFLLRSPIGLRVRRQPGRREDAIATTSTTGRATTAGTRCGTSRSRRTRRAGAPSSGSRSRSCASTTREAARSASRWSARSARLERDLDLAAAVAQRQRVRLAVRARCGGLRLGRRATAVRADAVHGGQGRPRSRRRVRQYADALARSRAPRSAST